MHITRGAITILALGLSLNLACAPASQPSPTAAPAKQEAKPAPSTGSGQALSKADGPAATAAPAKAAEAPASKPAEAKAAASPAAKAEAKPAGGAADQAVQKLYDAAKAEGQLQPWVQMDAKQVAVAVDAFKARFPGINVQPFEIRPEEAVSRLVSESAAGGKTTADSLQTNLPTAQVLVQRKLIESYDWASLGTSKEAIMGDNWGVAFFHAGNPMAYNTTMLKANEVPKSWEELLEPKWKGKVAFEYRGKAISGLHPLWGEQKTIEYIQKMKAQEPIIGRGAQTVQQAAIAGQAPIGIGALHYQISEAMQQGAPIALVPDLPVTVRAIGTTPLRGPHPNAARLWTWWLSSKEGQAAVIKAQGAGLLTPDTDSQPMADLRKANQKLVILNADEETKQGDIEKKILEILGG
jgi:iron(III) transport system substrate-binding protein